MKSKYIKIGIFFLLFITIAIINSSIRLQLFGAGIEKNEILSGKIISEINSIFYQEKAIKIDSLMNLYPKPVSADIENMINTTNLQGNLNRLIPGIT